MKISSLSLCQPSEWLRQTAVVVRLLLSYRLELHNPGTLTHREYLVVTRGGKERRIRLPLFDDARSGYVSAKTPNDWIVLHPTDDADIYRADTGRFLFVHKSFRINVQTGKVTSLSNG